MKLLIPLLLMFSSFAAAEVVEKMRVRVTYYWLGHITSTGTKPVHGKTAAVDPKVIPYGSHIHIPAMKKTFKAVDTGPDVRKKVASKGKFNVVDIYCSSKTQAQTLIKKYPMYMDIEITKPKK